MVRKQARSKPGRKTTENPRQQKNNKRKRRTTSCSPSTVALLYLTVFGVGIVLGIRLSSSWHHNNSSNGDGSLQQQQHWWFHSETTTTTLLLSPKSAQAHFQLHTSKHKKKRQSIEDILQAIRQKRHDETAAYRQHQKQERILRRANQAKKKRQQREQREQERQEEEKAKQPPASNEKTTKGVRGAKNEKQPQLLVDPTEIDEDEESFLNEDLEGFLKAHPMFNYSNTTQPRWFARRGLSYDQPGSYVHTDQTVAACLFLMDDSMRLLEWLAYHYTVLPLGYVMIAMDPDSRHRSRVIRIFKQWRRISSQLGINMVLYLNDTEWLDLKWDEGYGRDIRNRRNGHVMKWYETKGEIYRQQAHKRRQNYFSHHCLRYMKSRNMNWTMLIDSDEFLIYNYRHAREENTSLYDSTRKGFNRLDIERHRNEVAIIRDRLPPLDRRVTVADFLVNEAIPKPCIKMPGLQFSSQESDQPILVSNYDNDNTTNLLLTLRQRQTGPREGLFSKTMINVSFGSWSHYTFGNVVNVHNPNHLVCGNNGNSGSRADYIASIFRINHYKAGTLQAFLERSGDRRQGNMSLLERFRARDIEPILYDDDIVPWVSWFVDKVGVQLANELLFDPLLEAYRLYGNATKLAMQQQ